MDRIKKFVDEEKPARAVVVGGGFIGLEIAENLHHRGIRVTLIELINQVMAPIDYEMAALLWETVSKPSQKAMPVGWKSKQ